MYDFVEAMELILQKFDRLVKSTSLLISGQLKVDVFGVVVSFSSTWRNRPSPSLAYLVAEVLMKSSMRKLTISPRTSAISGFYPLIGAQNHCFVTKI